MPDQNNIAVTTGGEPPDFMDGGGDGDNDRPRRACDDGYEDVGYNPTWRKQFPNLFLSRSKTAELFCFMFDLHHVQPHRRFAPQEVANLFSDQTGQPTEANIVNNVFNYFSHADAEYLKEHFIAAVADRGRFPRWHDKMLEAGQKPAYVVPVRRDGEGFENVPHTGDDDETDRLSDIDLRLREAAKRGGNRARVIAQQGNRKLVKTATSAAKKNEVVRLSNDKISELLRLTGKKDKE